MEGSTDLHFDTVVEGFLLGIELLEGLDGLVFRNVIHLFEDLDQLLGESPSTDGQSNHATCR